MKTLVLILILICNTCLAIDVKPIKKGEAASFDGFLVSKEDLKKLRQINEEKKLLDKQNIKLKDLAAIRDSRVKLYKEEVEYNYKALQRERTKGKINGVLGFLVGVLATGAASYVAIKVSK